MFLDLTKTTQYRLGEGIKKDPAKKLQDITFLELLHYSYIKKTTRSTSVKPVENSFL